MRRGDLAVREADQHRRAGDHHALRESVERRDQGGAVKRHLGRSSARRR